MIYIIWMVSRTSAFSIVFGNDIFMTSFLVTWCSNLHILWTLPNAICLKTFNAVNCLGQVLQRNYKNTMMTSLWRHFTFLGLEISIFGETAYKLSSCQVWNSSVIWIKFYRSFYKTPQETIMTSLWCHFTIFGFQTVFLIIHVPLTMSHRK